MNVVLAMMYKTYDTENNREIQKVRAKCVLVYDKYMYMYMCEHIYECVFVR
jgi:hypothetical protein